MNEQQWTEYRTLKQAGWELQRENQVRLNGGSETIDHAVAKMLVAHAGHDAGYRVASEVVHEQRGEIDVLLYGVDGRLSLAVECETNPDDQVVEDKVDRYVRGTPIDDLVLVNVSTLPRDRMDAYRQVTEVLGLQ
jgi:hypothetical protein